MNQAATAVTVALRIPGQWSHPQELMGKLSTDHRLTPDALLLPDGTEIGFGAAPPDQQFAGIFRTSCREELTPQELAAVDGYKVNIFLSGPGGSKDAARTMMQAAAAIVRAGGAGVFIDNSGLAHGGQQWLGMAEDGSADALSFAFVNIVGGKTDIWTMGFHVLGLFDIIMKRADVEHGGFDIVEIICYLARGDKPVDDGHVIADLDGPRFQAFAQASPKQFSGTPMHNPFGRLKLVSLRDIAESN